MFSRQKNEMKTHKHTAAVIVAAGSGTRMGLEQSKQFIMIGDMPVLAHTLKKFSGAKTIDEIIIVSREEDILLVNDMTHEFEIEKVTSIVPGGKTRQMSVFHGLNAIHQDGAIAVIHDGARPFISSDSIDEIAEFAYSGGAAAFGIRVKDTIKAAGPNGIIQSTLPRDNLWQIQTPQVFEAEMIKNAHVKAMHDGFEASDDCMIAEYLGVPVTILKGSYNNIKITTPEDVAFGEFLVYGGNYEF